MNQPSRRLLFFVALVLLLPAIASRFVPEKKKFDPQPLRQLRRDKPQIVILSDSMVDNGVDPRLLGHLLGDRKVALLWYGGSSSASWYFRLKNYVVASGIHPDLVCIVFRNQLLTKPAFRTTLSFRYKLEAAMQEDEPVYRTVLGDQDRDQSAFENWFARVYPPDKRRYIFHDRVGLMLMRAISNFGVGVGRLEKTLNETFAVSNLRRGAVEEAANVSGEAEEDFDPSPRHSFLPHLVAVAKENAIPLCFIRVRRYPAPDGRVPESARMRRYMADLGAWLEKQGCFFIDDTGNLNRTADMFLLPGDDHMGPWAKKRSTELYAEELRPILGL